MSINVYTPETGTFPKSGENRTLLFLAGTIEMGNSEDWQSEILKQLADEAGQDGLGVFNPRRVVAPENQLEVNRQINWELDSLDKSSIVFVYLAKNSISPISLYELGNLQGGKADNKSVIVYCDPEYTCLANVIATTSHPKFHNPSVKVFLDYGAAFGRLVTEIKRRSLRF